MEFESEERSAHVIAANPRIAISRKTNLLFFFLLATSASMNVSMPGSISIRMPVIKFLLPASYKKTGFKKCPESNILFGMHAVWRAQEKRCGAKRLSVGPAFYRVYRAVGSFPDYGSFFSAGYQNGQNKIYGRLIIAYVYIDVHRYRQLAGIWFAQT